MTSQDNDPLEAQAGETVDQAPDRFKAKAVITDEKADKKSVWHGRQPTVVVTQI